MLGRLCLSADIDGEGAGPLKGGRLTSSLLLAASMGATCPTHRCGAPSPGRPPQAGCAWETAGTLQLGEMMIPAASADETGPASGDHRTVVPVAKQAHGQIEWCLRVRRGRRHQGDLSRPPQPG